MTRYLVLSSPVSGGGRAKRATPGVLATLRNANCDAELVVTSSCAEATERAAHADPDDVVVSLGGDGLHAAVTAGVLESGATFAPLPGGRGNDFVRAIGASRDPLVGAQRLAAGLATTRMVDVGVANGRAFLGIATVGYDSAANTIANDLPLKSGLAYIVGGAGALWVEHRAREFRISIDGAAPVRTRAHNIAVGDSGWYAGGVHAHPDARLDDGLLDYLVIEQQKTFFGLLRVILSLLKGSHTRQARVSLGTARSMTIDCDEPLTVYADGDPVTQLPLTLNIMPGALRVLA